MDLLNFIVKNDLRETYQELELLLWLFLTIPITTASSERSFSALRIIKNYLRNSMSDERLSNLVLLFIEKEITKSLNTDKLIDIFANEKARLFAG